jgi:hypothetical protein
MGLRLPAGGSITGQEHTPNAPYLIYCRATGAWKGSFPPYYPGWGSGFR